MVNKYKNVIFAKILDAIKNYCKSNQRPDFAKNDEERILDFINFCCLYMYMFLCVVAIKFELILINTVQDNLLAGN